MYEKGAKTIFLKENLCVLQVFLCALISRLHTHSLEGTLIVTLEWFVSF